MQGVDRPDHQVQEQGPGDGDRATGPAVGVVVPLFKHSVLIGDALASVVAQRATFPIVAVVVNDGCPFLDSHTHVKALRSVHPTIIKYLARPNGGLSAARNTGIDYLLNQYPSVQAIYFLDSDNRLRPTAIENSYRTLLAETGADWVYPNIDMFGLERNFDYSGPYLPLLHMFHNICEAGSLVHRRVFDAGLRFDEAMRHGYEDWEFWLHAIAKGFRGVHHPHFGFLYRNRAESMLSQSKREDAAIRTYVRKKHIDLMSREAMLSRQDHEAPRHALVFLDTNEVVIGFDGQSNPKVVSRTAFDTMLWRSFVIPGCQPMPQFLLFMTRTAFDQLTQAGVMAWVIYDSEVVLTSHNFACIELEGATRSVYAVKPSAEIRRAAVLAIKLDLLASIVMDPHTDWFDRLSAPVPDMKVSVKTLLLPPRFRIEAGITGVILVGFMVSVLGWREARFREAAHHRWIWRDRSVPPPSHLSHDVDLFLGLSVPYPSFRPSGRNIGFVLRVGGFGGVERVAWNVAMQFAANGWSVHLFMVGADQVDLPDKFGETFSSINFLDHAMFGGFDDQQKYQGTALPRTGANPAAVHRLVGALGWLDVVVNCHSGDLNGAAALLRRQGTLTATHLHILDHSPARRSVGHPILAVAYEHAYDLVLCCSQNLLAWIRAAGVPDDKLVLLPNAPGYPMTPAAVREVVARRTMPQAGQLHALFIGRLDRQKGIGRLADVIAETRRLALDIEWRIVGAPAFDSPPLPPLVQEMVEPPVYRAEQLTALYGWADVMVLLSDYEGVPLSILEAQRLGVVVISTDVGGVSEIIEQGASGFLVHPDTAVIDTVELLRWLAGSPGTVSAVAQAAVNVPDWSQSCAELLRRVSALLADRSGC